MLGLAIKLLAGSAGPYIAGAVAAVLALAIGAAGVQTLRLGHAKADLASYRTALADEHRAFLAEQAHSRALEAARGQEHGSAVVDASAQERACTARVAVARKSAASIVQILNEPPHANPDPAEPELLSAGQLRHAQGR